MSNLDSPIEIPIDIQGLERSFGAKKVLDGLDLMVPKGVVYGLVGEWCRQDDPDLPRVGFAKSAER